MALPGNGLYHFRLPSFHQKSVSWSHRDPRDAGKCNLAVYLGGKGSSLVNTQHRPCHAMCLKFLVALRSLLRFLSPASQGSAASYFHMLYVPCGAGLENRPSEKSLEGFEISGRDKVGHEG